MSAQPPPIVPDDRNDAQGRQVAIRPNTGDRMHDLQLLRDAQMVNERTLRELGPLPPGGLPAQIKRKPVLPQRPARPPQAVFERPLAPARDVAAAEPSTLGASSAQEPAMDIITLPDGTRVRANPWPLKFEKYSFDARCYNTLRCSIIYNNDQHSLHVEEPSGQPRSPDWKSTWSGSYNPYDNRNFAPPASIGWVSLDGTRHRAEVDFAEIFKDRLIRHDVPREEIPEGWAHRLRAEVLLEVNDRSINVYMKVRIAMKTPQKPDNPYSYGRTCLTLVWSKNY
jgi:hypothetical protein